MTGKQTLPLDGVNTRLQRPVLNRPNQNRCFSRAGPSTFSWTQSNPVTTTIYIEMRKLSTKGTTKESLIRN